jgi:WD40 repeat protein
VAWHPAGTHLATGSRDRFARVFDVASGREILRLEHSFGVSSVAWNAAGTQLATGCVTARVFDVASGEAIQEFGQSGGVLSVAWNTGGTRLATGCWDDFARVFHVAASC